MREKREKLTKTMLEEIGKKEIRDEIDIPIKPSEKKR